MWSFTPREYGALRRIWERTREHLDMRFAEVQATLHNIYRDTKEHPKPFKVAEFMPGYQAPEVAPADRAETMKAKIMAQAKMFQAMKGQRRARDGR